jgi:hypothetical protein
LGTASGGVEIKAPKLKGISFETAVIERYRRGESSIKEALIELYPASVSVRGVEDSTEALWRSEAPAAAVSGLNKKDAAGSVPHLFRACPKNCVNDHKAVEIPKERLWSRRERSRPKKRIVSTDCLILSTSGV